MKELLQELDSAAEILKDFGKFKHLFSDDDGTSTLAKLRNTVQQIRLRAQMTKIKEIEYEKADILRSCSNSGKLVKIRPCGKEYGEKTYLGLYLGDMATSPSLSIKDDKIAVRMSMHNPAMFVFDLSKIIFGYESFWGVIKTEADLSGISDNDIDSLWYVKALKQATGADDGR